MTKALYGFLKGYDVVNINGESIGWVSSCILDLEEGIITHLELNVHDHTVLLPFRKCIILHRHKCVKLGI